VQLDYMVAVINTALEGRRVPHAPKSRRLIRWDSSFYPIWAFNFSNKSVANY